jgi:hypothetical protein
MWTAPYFFAPVSANLFSVFMPVFTPSEVKRAEHMDESAFACRPARFLPSYKLPTPLDPQFDNLGIRV